MRNLSSDSGPSATMLKGTSWTFASRRVAVTMISSSTVPSAATAWATAAPIGAERPSAAATAAAIRDEYPIASHANPLPDDPTGQHRPVPRSVTQNEPSL